jgi:hypothetical protein
MRKRAWAFLFISIFFSFSISGCYYFSAKNEMKAAEKSVSELKAAGGQTLVPYEYCSAEKFLEISKLEAAENDWKAARDFANRSRSAAEAGLAEIKKK